VSAEADHRTGQLEMGREEQPGERFEPVVG
jgi:hypothetical protein